MSIGTTLTAVKDVIKKVDGFTDNNVGIGSWLMLDRGVEKAVVVLYRLPEYGPRIGMAAAGQVGWRHLITVRLFSKYKDNEENCYSNLMTDLYSVIGKLTEYPRLNSATGVMDSNIIEAPEFFILPDTDGQGAAFFGIDILLEVYEESSPSYAE